MIQAQISKVNVTIDGPGVVDEYLTLNTDGTKQLKLKAVPSKFLGNVTFDGWSGIETVNDELKNIAQVEHSRHRSFDNFMVNLLGALAAYCFFPKKPCISCERAWAGSMPTNSDVPTMKSTTLQTADTMGEYRSSSKGC